MIIVKKTSSYNKQTCAIIELSLLYIAIAKLRNDPIVKCIIIIVV